MGWPITIHKWRGDDDVDVDVGTVEWRWKPAENFVCSHAATSETLGKSVCVCVCMLV